MLGSKWNSKFDDQIQGGIELRVPLLLIYCAGVTILIFHSFPSFYLFLFFVQDQKVSWHATPFEERLEKALSDEKLFPQRSIFTVSNLIFSFSHYLKQIVVKLIFNSLIFPAKSSI